MIFWGLLVLQAAAFALAVRRLGWWTPLTIVLAFAVLDHGVLELLHAWLDGGPRPFTGLRAAGYHASVGLVVGWPALLASAAWGVFGCKNDRRLQDPEAVAGSGHNSGRRSYGATTVINPARNPDRLARDLLVGAWLVAAGGMAAVYPLPKGWTAPLLHGVELAFVAAALAAIPAGWRSRRIVSVEGRAVGLLVVTELCVSLLGAWGAGAKVFTAWDELARLPYLIAWGVLVALLARR